MFVNRLRELEDGGGGELGPVGAKQGGGGGGGGGEEVEEEEDTIGDMRCYVTLVHKINTHAHTGGLGKNGRFQLLICLCAR